MVNEEAFSDNASQYEHWKNDRDGYMEWLNEKIALPKAESRAHGLHHWDQYKDEVSKMAEVGDGD